MGLRRFFRRAKWDRERLEEIESYVQIETDENIARGMEYPEACAAARRKFGNRILIREEIYAVNTIVFFDTLVRDLRYGLRHAAPQSHIHRRRPAYPRDRNRRQHGGFYRRQQHAAQAS